MLQKQKADENIFEQRGQVSAPSSTTTWQFLPFGSEFIVQDTGKMLWNLHKKAKEIH